MFMFEIAILYITFNMATSNINKMSNHNKKRCSSLPLCFKKNLLYLGNVIDIASTLSYFWKNYLYYISVGFNKVKKLKLTLKFTLAKAIFN